MAADDFCCHSLHCQVWSESPWLVRMGYYTLHAWVANALELALWRGYYQQNNVMMTTRHGALSTTSAIALALGLGHSAGGGQAEEALREWVERVGRFWTVRCAHCVALRCAALCCVTRRIYICVLYRRTSGRRSGPH